MARNKYDVDEQLETPFDFTHLRRSFVYIKRYKAKMILKKCIPFCKFGFNYLKFKKKIFKNNKRDSDTNTFKSTSGNLKNYLFIYLFIYLI